MIYRLFIVLLFAMPLLLSSCSPGEGEEAGICDSHFDIHFHLDEWEERFSQRDVSGIKVIIANGETDSLNLSATQLIENFSALREFDIDQPNLIGRYRCVDSVANGRKLEIYTAMDDRLSVRKVEIEKEEELIKVRGAKYIGSVIASIEKSFEWNLLENEVVLEIQYKNMFGKKHEYWIKLFWEAE